HLQALVDEDPDDREAWGELLECLDALGDRERLAAALGRRADRSTGIERREIVRRRAALLVDMGKGAEALEQLQGVRAELSSAGGVDAELKLLERRIHESRGVHDLGAFLAREIAADVARARGHAPAPAAMPAPMPPPTSMADSFDAPPPTGIHDR